MKITQDVREYAAQKEIDEAAALDALTFYFWQFDGQWWKPINETQHISFNPTVRQADTTSPKLGVSDSLLYSAYVAALQKPEPVPENKRAKSLVLIEMILGPLQAALWGLAIRRKFMR